MPSRIKEFLQTDVYEPQIAGTFFDSPVCYKVEHHFREIFETGKQKTPGRITGPDAKLWAQVYKGTIFNLSEWLDDAREMAPNEVVLLKNPAHAPNEVSGCGETNALVAAGGYVFVATPRVDGFTVRRPVRGRNINGSNIDYQHELARGFDVFIRGLPQGYTAPRWGVGSLFS